MKIGKQLLAILLSVSMTAAPSVSVMAENYDAAPEYYEDGRDIEILIEDTYEDTVGDDILEDEVVIEDDSFDEDVVFIEDEDITEDDFSDNAEDTSDDETFEETDEQPESEEVDDSEQTEQTDEDITIPDEQEEISEEAFTEDEDIAISVVEEAEDLAIYESDAEYALVGEGLNASPEGINKTIETFADAIGKFTADMTEKGQLETLLTRFGGVTSMAGGAIAILQMTGIIKDSTGEALSKILSEIGNIENTLADMQADLKAISKKLDDMAAKDEERDRQSTASARLTKWQNFDAVNAKPLRGALKEYDTYVKNGMITWWKEHSHDGIRLYYAAYKGQPSRTYSRVLYETFDSAGNPVISEIPTTADNGEEILTDRCIGIPSSCMPNTSATAWDVDKYGDNFKKLMAAAIISAADEHKLEASDAFYAEWAKLDNTGKNNKALDYAEDALHTIIYQVSCDIMAHQQYDWVTHVIHDYTEYCSALLEAENGIDALINVEYLTHGFEGEVKDDIINIIDSMIASAGFYGTFALSVAAQDYMHQDAAAKEELQNTWVKTITSLDKLKETSLHGADNYCYVLGGTVGFEQRRVESSITVVSKERYAYLNHSSTGWNLIDLDGNDAGLPALMKSNVPAIVLYHEYMRQKAGSETFAQYLHKNGVNIPADFSGKLMTNYRGVKDFNLGDGPWLLSTNVFGDYFKDNKWSRINKDNPSKIKDDYFKIHDSVQYDYIDTSSGDTEEKDTIAMRALCLDYDPGYFLDEAHIFRNDSDISHSSKKEYYKYDPWAKMSLYKYTDRYELISNKISMLTVGAVSKESLPENGPIVSFGQDYILKVNEEEETPPYSDANWDSLNFEFFDFDSEDGNIDSTYTKMAETAVTKLQDEGIEITCSEEDIAGFVARMKEKTAELKTEMMANGSLLYRDLFGIDGNEAAELALAKAVLPPSYIDKDGKVRITAENMDTFPQYHALAMIHLAMTGNALQPVINPLIFVRPILVVWDPVSEVFASFSISDEVMKSLGLSMNMRLPAASAGDSASIDLLCYDRPDEIDPAVRKTAELFGSGKDRYAGFSSSACGAYELLLTPVAESITNAEVKLSRKLFTYSGKVLKPAVKTIGGKVLTAGTDYDLAWSNAASKKPGTYTVTITGRGNYSGKTTAEYRIKKAMNPLAPTRKKASVTLGAKALEKKAQTIRREDIISLGKFRGSLRYQLVSVNKAAYAKYFAVSAKTGKITVKKGLKKGSYTLKIRVIASGDDCYNAISKVLQFRVVVK